MRVTSPFEVCAVYRRKSFGTLFNSMVYKISNTLKMSLVMSELK